MYIIHWLYIEEYWYTPMTEFTQVEIIPRVYVSEPLYL